MSEMKTHTIAPGVELPALGLGTWKSEAGDCHRAVKEALRAGYRHVDGAWIYGNEEEVGRAIRESIADGVVRRDEVFLTSKLWNSFHRPDDVGKAIEDTLGKLGLDHVDLYLMHWPIAFAPGVGVPRSPDQFLPLREVPLADTFGAMIALRERGLVRAVGVSNHSASKLEALTRDAGEAPAVNQVELHPRLAQRDLLAFGEANGIHHTAYSPLGSNDRPDSMKKHGPPPLLDDPTVVNVAADEGVTPGQLLIAWALDRGTSAIPKSTNPARIRENLAAADHRLSDDARKALDAMDEGARFIDPRGMFVSGVTHEGDDFWA